MPLSIADLHRGAEGGSCGAQCVLGLCYLYGIDVEINYTEALRLLTSADEHGGSRAMLNLGYMFAKGLGTKKNVAEAIAGSRPLHGASPTSFLHALSLPASMRVVRKSHAT